ncbi:glycosyltransferase [Desulfomicrobium salsuginis]
MKKNILNQYYQERMGFTENIIDVKPMEFVGKTESCYSALNNYEIRDIGIGFNAIAKIINHIFQTKLKKNILWNDSIFQKCVVVEAKSKIIDIKSNKTYSKLKPKSLHDINRYFESKEHTTRSSDINKYKKLIINNNILPPPLFISGETLNNLGANINPYSIYMIDGARRICAHAITHHEFINIKLIVTEKEFSNFVEEKETILIKNKIDSIPWFPNYQSIPLIGLKGDRSTKRFELFDNSILMNQTIFDFGCNTGQACITAALAGAKEVWGIEGIFETYNVAKQIAKITKISNLNYLNIDFNDFNFESEIDKYTPEFCDYSFFFSVYRTKELTNRDKLFKYIINKTSKGIFFEGHAHKKIDTIEYYDWLFSSFSLKYNFLGFSEKDTRPLFFIDTQKQNTKLYLKKADKNNTMKDNKYTISAIVSTYKSEKFIKSRLDNLLSQTIADKIEIIVLDSNSPENEKKIVNDFQLTNENIKYFRTIERETVYQAWNRAIKISTGKYIITANSDDILRDDALEIMSNELDNNPSTALVYADYFITNIDNQNFYKHIRTGYSIKPDYSPDIMLSGCHIGPQPLWRKSIHNKIGYFDESLISASDYEFWCRIATQYKMKHINDFLGLYYHNPNGIVNKNSNVNNIETSIIKQKYVNAFPRPKSFITGHYYKKHTPKNKYVNICMITHNRLDFTQQSIDSILKHTIFPYTLTVIDNNSNSDTKLYLNKLKQKGIIKNLILLDKNIGVAKASNLAWSLEPNADYYLKIDNDIVINKYEWLNNLVDIADNIAECGAVAYNFEPVSYPIHVINGRRIRIKIPGNLGGACILIPRRTHEILGFWCEDYGLYGEEDADYGARILLSKKLNIYMEDENIGIHLPGGKAAIIDPKTFVALDEKENCTHYDYRKWKDEQRLNNIKSGKLHSNISNYINNNSNLYFNSNFAETLTKNKLVTIIIPVFNNANLTKNCINSIYKHTTNFELIIIDNGSTDQTSSILKQYNSNIKVISNIDNRGFARACNQGAHAADTKYLLFLNNDTIVTENWLTYLLLTAESDESIGCVGSKLLYMDNTIQHCGVVFDTANRPYHIYQGLSSQHPVANKKRTFKSITGACLLISKKLFFEFGPFDENFTNGFEDVDLCLKLHKNGHAIYYEPKSVVFHIESQTEGRFLHSIDNTNYFLSKWNDLNLCDENYYYDNDEITVEIIHKDNIDVIEYVDDKNITTIANNILKYTQCSDDYERKLIECTQLNQYAKNNLTIFKLLADYYISCNKFIHAEETYKMIAQIEPTKTNYIHLANIQKQLNKFNEAINTLKSIA